MLTGMRFSVVIPCHNAEPWVAEALASVAEQAYQPHEIVVVLDACSDGSSRSVRKSRVDCRVLEVNCGNGAAARNAGIEAASGDWIAFLDADDRWLPHHLSQAVDLLEGTDCVAYMSHRKTCRQDNVPEEGAVPYNISEPTTGLDHREYLRRFVASGRKFFTSSSLMRRDRLLEVGMLDPSQIRRHDIDVWLRVIHGRTWAFHPNASTVYRVDTPGSLSRNIADRERWFLKVLLKNQHLYEMTEMRNLIRAAAQRCLSAAITDGEEVDIAPSRELAWGHLSRIDRLLFRFATATPAIFRRMNRARRRMRGIK